MEYTALKVDTTLHLDTYEIKEVLGKGGFGVTYKAFDRNLEKMVAIKEFFPSDLCGRKDDTNHITIATQNSSQMVVDLKAKFLKEARNIAKLNHPNIIKIHFIFEENNTAYYVMEYIEGESLSQKIKQNGPLSVEDATEYISAIGDALGYLHDRHMTHLDVKPANIMVRRSDNVPFLIDFGLSKNYDVKGSATTTTNLMGISPGFSPMEQYVMSGIKGFSPRLDLYSLAASYYFLLTGKVPMEAPMNPVSKMEFPSYINPGIRSAIITAMNADPEQRQPLVKNFIEQISLNGPQNENTVISNSASARYQGEETVIANPTGSYSGYQNGNYGGNGGSDNYSGESGGSGNYYGGNGTDYPGNQYDKNQKFGISKDKLGWMVAGAVALILAGVLIALLVRNPSPEEGRTEVANTEKSGINDGKITEIDNQEENGKIEVETSREPEPPKLKESPYGPFSSKGELENFLVTYFSSFDDGSYGSNYIADKITTDFGTPQTFTKSQYIAEQKKYRKHLGYLYSSHDFDWESLRATPTSNGGVKVNFTQTYDLTTQKDGDVLTRQYRLKTEIEINSQGLVSKVKESSQKIGEWYEP